MPPDTFGIPSLTAWSVVSLLLSVILFAIFVVAIELALAVRAHSVKEAGTVLGPFVIAFIIPAMFAQFVNLEGIEWWWFVAPIFNVCLAMREALLDITDITHIALWLTSSLCYAILAVTWAAKQFKREDLVESLS
jgi:ABC-type Na+ efflux pump permease subunit